MRKDENKTTRFAIIVLALTMIVLILVSGTYAKYTASAEITGNARVAIWKVTVGGKDITKNETIDIKLFDTIYDAENSATGAVATAAENEVVTSSSATKIIAPGTSGKFQIDVENLSEVDALYTWNFTVDNTNNIPLEFKAGESGTWSSNINSLNVTETLAKVASEKATTATASGKNSIIVYWRWAFEGTNSATHTEDQTDIKDTQLGVAAQTADQTVTVHANINVTQVN